ncbi:MAG: glutamate formimidoyltransferase [Bryobacterales bacterium]|nr:glutamate formimidoyltransferase [Bryobacterales bacterium]MBV9397514.1 glutamate formimidoyltransferase [Bryobacterales bacterium]
MIECVPNFSEGRDAAIVCAIVESIRATPGVLLLGWESDADHNRSVVTFAGTPEPVVEAAVRAAGKAAGLIDLAGHWGEHPRVGAADVIPFVPLAGASLEDCAKAAHRAGAELWSRFGIPVYFYEAAALTPGRERLEKVRRREFDGLPPDIGNLTAHPSWGASMVGARHILIAYNVLLETADTAIARAIAKKIRASSGGFPHVKAIGLFLASASRAQVSMNLTRFMETPLDRVFETIEAEAQRLGTRVLTGELIGFIPRRAYELFPAFFDRAENFNPARIIENRIEQLLNSN